MAALNQNSLRLTRMAGLSTWQTSPGAQAIPLGRAVRIQELNASSTPTSGNTMFLCRPIAINQGATSRVDAMTEPRPRLTKTIGSVQQTSVVTTGGMLMMPETRSRIRTLYCRVGCARSDWFGLGFVPDVQECVIARRGDLTTVFAGRAIQGRADLFLAFVELGQRHLQRDTLLNLIEVRQDFRDDCLVLAV